MAATIETERKFDLPDGFELPDLGHAVGPAERLKLDAVYYDTADLRLARRRVTLRRRTGGHDAGWHIKRPSGEARSEMQYALDESGPAQRDVRALTRGEALVPVARLRTRRDESPVTDKHGRVLALLAFDTVRASRLLPPVDESTWRELEVELVGGDVALLDAIESALATAGAVRSSSASKLSRTIGDRYPAAPDPAAGSVAGRALAAYVRAQRDALLHNDPLARSGDADGVHDMRVATRRLRSTLSTFFAGRETGIEDELRWLADELGAVRDRDVLADLIVADIAECQPELLYGPVTRRIRAHLAGDEEAARAALREAMDSPRYFDLLDRIDEIADRVAPEGGRSALYKRAGKRLRTADERLAGALEMPSSPERDVALHGARKAYKKARYAVELLTGLGGEPAEWLAKRLRQLQDTLGAHQDGVIAAELMREIGAAAHASGEDSFPYGQIQVRVRESADARLDDLPRRIQRAGKPAVRDWLDRPNGD